MTEATKSTATKSTATKSTATKSTATKSTATKSETKQTEERTEKASNWETMVDTVFPNQTNPLGTLFGGHVLELMDVNASIACLRFCRLPVVTASTEPIDFRNPIFVGEIIELRSKVVWTGTTSMIVRSEVYGENPLSGERRLCTIGHLNFVALKDGKPTPVPNIKIETEEEQDFWDEACKVRENIKARRK